MEGKRPLRGTLNFSIFQKNSAMEIFNVIFEKGSSKESSKKTYNEYQNFATVDGFHIYGQWL